MKAHTSNNSFSWVKSESGELYVCSLDVVKKHKGKLSEEELRRLCIDESSRPWND